MAKCKFIEKSDQRGKLGGMVYTRGHYGAVVRTKVKPINPRTTAQLNVRAHFTASSKAWKGLSAANRLTFIEAVTNFVRRNVFGDKVNPTGFNLFMELNNNIRAIAGTPITTAPLPAAVAGMTTNSIAMGAGAQTAVLTYTPAIPASVSMILSMTPGLSAGKRYVKTQYRQIGVYQAADTSPLNIATAYEAVFGTVPAAGTQVFFKIKPILTASGQPGPITTGSCIVSA